MNYTSAPRTARTGDNHNELAKTAVASDGVMAVFAAAPAYTAEFADPVVMASDDVVWEGGAAVGSAAAVVVVVVGGARLAKPTWLLSKSKTE